jgi:hypothetical protein
VAPVKVVPKKTDLEVGLEKILGGEKEAAPLKELLSKITKEAKPKMEEDFLKKVLDCIKPCTNKAGSPNVLNEILEREEPSLRSLQDCKIQNNKKQQGNRPYNNNNPRREHNNNKKPYNNNRGGDFRPPVAEWKQEDLAAK